jgi:phosphatidylglycerophosphatase A
MPFITKLIASFFYIGYLPRMPGTFASVAGLFIFYLLRDEPLGLAAVTVIVLVLGFVFCGKAERLYGKKDPGCIVIDEVAGILIAFMFVPFSLYTALVGFSLFRILDIFKLYPAGPLQNLRGSAGIMLDDITAGLYTNIILQLTLKFASS